MTGFFFVAGIIAIGAIVAFSQSNPVEAIRQGVQSGSIVYRLTEPDEVKALAGQPQQEATRPDGGMLLLTWSYPGIELVFGKMKEDKRPFVLLSASAEGKALDIGQNRKLVLRTAADLAKMDEFWGLENVSLVRLDLRDRIDDLNALPFDSLTEWPPADRLPPGFSPAALLSEGMNPGLGLRALHAAGIDGRGVGIAIIDQPLVRDHIEYAAALARYDATGLESVPPQMHGPAVLSIAVGRSCGVAPGAEASFFAVPMWERDNAPFLEAMKKVFALNDGLPEEKRIRVVSISTGMFSEYPHYEEWTKACAEAERRGILVITCAPDFLNYGTLVRIPGRDADDPESYLKGRYGAENAILNVFAGNRTVASPRGKDVYTFCREGGMSWTAPYMAGLAALALQMNPRLLPRDIIRLIVETAAPTSAGPVVNPGEFVRKAKEK